MRQIVKWLGTSSETERTSALRILVPFIEHDTNSEFLSPSVQVTACCGVHPVFIHCFIMVVVLSDAQLLTRKRMIACELIQLHLVGIW